MQVSMALQAFSPPEGYATYPEELLAGRATPFPQFSGHAVIYSGVSVYADTSSAGKHQ